MMEYVPWSTLTRNGGAVGSGVMFGFPGMDGERLPLCDFQGQDSRPPPRDLESSQLAR